MLWSTCSRQPRPTARTRPRPLPFRPRLELLEDRRLPSVFLVTNNNNGGAGSLRQAILNANVNPGYDTIEFDIEPGGLQTISLTSPLPTLADPVFIDATSQPGWVADPLIRVDGLGLNVPSNGLTITADGCKVKGLLLTDFKDAGIGLYSNNNVVAGDRFFGNDVGVEIANAVSGNVIGGTTLRGRNLIQDNRTAGVSIHERSTGNLVEGNYIGTDPTGNAGVSNGTGVLIFDGAGNNTIGGAAAGAGNLISGNTGDGIYIRRGVTGVLVQGNQIGTNAAGSAAVANRFSGVEIAGPSNTVGGTAAGAGNLISGNSQQGIVIDGAGTGVLVQGNQIGTNAAGTAALANGMSGVEMAASNNTVGGTAAGAGNLISGNSQDGIVIDGSVTGVLVQGNQIGTNATGTAALANGRAGVEIAGPSNTVGGTAAGAGNLVSGNSLDGIRIDIGATANLVQGNKIGTNAAGSAALANGVAGVEIFESSNTVGGTAASAGNLISGNSQDGIFIATNANLVQGNKIGTNAAGKAPLPNGASGVEIRGASSNSIGGTAAGAGNLISGNTLDGILITDVPAAASTANLVQGNKIGTNVAGTGAVANGGSGVHILASNNTVGGTTAGAANTIAFNKADGVFVESGTGNAIRQNSIFANAGLGIRAAPGANNNQPAPTLSSATYNPFFFFQTLSVKGTMTGVPGSQVTLEFFANPAGDPEGKVFLGSLVVTIGPGGSVSFTFTLHTTAVSKGMLITATATDANNGTSQFSAGRKVT
jgi:hypothetical protein